MITNKSLNYIIWRRNRINLQNFKMAPSVESGMRYKHDYYEYVEKWDIV